MIGNVHFGRKIKKGTKHLFNAVLLQKAPTTLSPFKKDFTFNYRVENLSELLEELKEKGITVMDKVEEYYYVKFG